MKINSVLDICLSLMVVYALFSILVSVVNEWFSHFFDRRSKLLREAITKIIDDKFNLNYAELFFNHYSIQAITRYRFSMGSRFLQVFGAKVQPTEKGPQYISSQTFADVLIDLIANQHLHQQSALPEKDEKGFAKLDAEGKKIFVLTSPESTLPLHERFQASLKNLHPSPFTDILKGFSDKAGADQEKLKRLIAEWFDTYMERVSGWYKNKQRSKVLVIGFIVAIGLNIDSLHLLKVIAMDDTLRANLVATGEQIAKEYAATNDSIRQTTAAQLRFFQKADSVMKSAPNTTTAQSSAVTPAQKDVPKEIKELEKLLIRADSASKKYRDQKDEILGIAADLSLPIGWNREMAPWSWCKREVGGNSQTSTETDRHTKNYWQEGGMTGHQGLLAYEQERNAGTSFWVILKYVLGILITAVSLSFGAPFWFDVLARVVNIRRSGTKPEKKN